MCSKVVIHSSLIVNIIGGLGHRGFNSKYNWGDSHHRQNFVPKLIILFVTDRYMTEVRRLALPPTEVEPISHGFRDLEEMLQG